MLPSFEPCQKADICAAAIEASIYHQIDDTAARVCGQNYHTHIMCNELYAAYFTMARKDRLTILDILRQFKSREYLFNEESARLLEALRVPEEMRRKITQAPQFKLLTESLGLCWVHDGRHYKKLCPVAPYHAQLLRAFREQYWDFYAKLLMFKARPSVDKYYFLLFYHDFWRGYETAFVHAHKIFADI